MRRPDWNTINTQDSSLTWQSQNRKMEEAITNKVSSNKKIKQIQFALSSDQVTDQIREEAYNRKFLENFWALLKILWMKKKPLQILEENNLVLTEMKDSEYIFFNIESRNPEIVHANKWLANWYKNYLKISNSNPGYIIMNNTIFKKEDVYFYAIYKVGDGYYVLPSMKNSSSDSFILRRTQLMSEVEVAFYNSYVRQSQKNRRAEYSEIFRKLEQLKSEEALVSNTIQESIHNIKEWVASQPYITKFNINGKYITMAVWWREITDTGQKIKPRIAPPTSIKYDIINKEFLAKDGNHHPHFIYDNNICMGRFMEEVSNYMKDNNIEMIIKSMYSFLMHWSSSDVLNTTRSPISCLERYILDNPEEFCSLNNEQFKKAFSEFQSQDSLDKLLNIFQIKQRVIEVFWGLPFLEYDTNYIMNENPQTLLGGYYEVGESMPTKLFTINPIDKDEPESESE